MPAMIVTNTPAKDLAYTNFAYCSPTDFRNFLVTGSRLAYALIGDVFVLSIAYPFYRPHIYLTRHVCMLFFPPLYVDDVFNVVAWWLGLMIIFIFFIYENVIEFCFSASVCRF